MTKFTHASLFRAASTLWFCIGIFLMTRGIYLIVPATDNAIISQSLPNNMSPLFSWIRYFTNTTHIETSLLFTLIGLFLGTLKARTILKKTVLKNIERINLLPEQVSLFSAFGKKDYCIMFTMILLGFIIKYLGIYNDIRGLILIAVGAGLIQGSLLYRQACSMDIRKNS